MAATHDQAAAVAEKKATTCGLPRLLVYHKKSTKTKIDVKKMIRRKGHFFRCGRITCPWLSVREANFDDNIEPRKIRTITYIGDEREIIRVGNFSPYLTESLKIRLAGAGHERFAPVLYQP